MKRWGNLVVERASVLTITATSEVSYESAGYRINRLHRYL